MKTLRGRTTPWWVVLVVVVVVVWVIVVVTHVTTGSHGFGAADGDAGGRRGGHDLMPLKEHILDARTHLL